MATAMSGRRAAVLRLMVAVVASLAGPWLAPLAAQPETEAPFALQSQQIEELLGKTIRLIEIRGSSNEEYILNTLKTKVGSPLSKVDIAEDLRTLWDVSKIVASARASEVDGGVRLIFEVEEPKSYDRIEFKGLDHFSESEVRPRHGA